MLQNHLLSLSENELQGYVLAHENEDERKLVLSHRVIHGVPSSLVADQISGRRKAKSKLPSLYRAPGIVYPPSLHIEQSSSELTAKYKTSILVQAATGLKMAALSSLGRGVDLTGGFGIDSLFMGPVCRQFDYIEPNRELLAIAEHNHVLLGATNIRHHVLSAELFLATSIDRFDFAFIDPSRRSSSKKVFRLSDSQPNVAEILPAILKKSQHVLIKASPLLDLQQGCKELKQVEKIFVVAVDSECKEVLFLCGLSALQEPLVTAVNLSGCPERVDLAVEEFSFTFSQERQTASVISDPLSYLYEPNSAILKAGAFNLIGHRYALFKLHVNTHLYTADHFIEDFPGRVFKIENREIAGRKGSGGLKANVLTRNYPLTSEQLKKKLKLEDGGEMYVLGFSGPTKKFLVSAVRVR
jgi:hypothetical protein